MAKSVKRAAGEQGEQLARRHLEKKGLVFLQSNWRSKTGEIDLIMKDPAAGERGTLVIVEVRTRIPTMWGEGLETVAANKQRRLIRTAQYYMQEKKWWADVRFDVVSIRAGREKVSIEHIEHAFEAY